MITKEIDYLSLEQIAESGQCFRWRKLDDNKYMIKTLKYEELDIIRCKFLKEYAEYVKENKNTLLCPIYGIFKMII